MHPFDFPLLADESIGLDVIVGLVARGCDVAGVVERGLAGSRDRDVLRLADREGRVVVTHDSDFGTLAIHGGEPMVGIVYLRPGHVDASEVLRQIDAVRGLDIDARPPFVLAAQRRGEHVKIRLRQMVPR